MRKKIVCKKIVHKKIAVHKNKAVHKNIRSACKNFFMLRLYSKRKAQKRAVVPPFLIKSPFYVPDSSNVSLQQLRVSSVYNLAAFSVWV